MGVDLQYELTDRSTGGDLTDKHDLTDLIDQQGLANQAEHFKQVQKTW